MRAERRHRSTNMFHREASMSAHRLICAAGVIATGMSASPVMAQTATGATADSSLQEIVVTAEKRSSTVQDTPISITAVSGEQLQQQGINDLQSIVQSIPGLS